MSQSWKKVKTIQQVATSAEASAGKITVFVRTGVPAVATGAFAYILGITRSGASYYDITNKAIHAYSAVSGAVVVRTNSSDFVLTANDVVTIIGTYI